MGRSRRGLGCGCAALGALGALLAIGAIAHMCGGPSATPVPTSRLDHAPEATEAADVRPRSQEADQRSAPVMAPRPETAAAAPTAGASARPPAAAASRTPTAAPAATPEPGSRGADRVILFLPGPGANALYGDPGTLLGEPDGVEQPAYQGLLQLGREGTVLVGFTDNAVFDGPGPDLQVFGETAGDDSLAIEVSADGVHWFAYPRLSESPDPLDLADLPLDRAVYVRLTDVQPGTRTGAEVDAVVALHSDPGPGEDLPGSWEAGRIPARVVGVTDGDTIQVAIAGATYPLRYIGMDAPEPRDLFGSGAAQANRTLVAGRTVYLETDVTPADKYGRLLRYAYLPDGTFVNAELIRLGWAVAKEYPPDTRYRVLLAQAQQEAMQDGVGLWGPTPTPKPKPRPTPTPALGTGCDPCYPSVCIPPPPPDLDCGQIPFCRFTVLCDPHRFDGDGDGIGCESCN